MVGWPNGQLNKYRFKQYFLGAKLLFLPNQLFFLVWTQSSWVTFYLEHQNRQIYSCGGLTIVNSLSTKNNTNILRLLRLFLTFSGKALCPGFHELSYSCVNPQLYSVTILSVGILNLIDPFGTLSHSHAQLFSFKWVWNYVLFCAPLIKLFKRQKTFINTK